jgi:phage terminase large subunit
MFLELKNGSLWRIMGTDKIESVGAGPIGVVWSEYALGKPKAWNLVRPMLRENGGWSLFITTPRGNNHAKKLYDDAKKSGWYTDHKTVYETGQTFFSETQEGRIGPDAMMEEERASGMPEALIRQEYLCDWTAANVGAVFGDLIGEPSAFTHPDDGVFTSWDLGFTDSTAIWFWRIGSGGGIDLIDHYENYGKPMSHYFDVVEGKPYKYVKHWLPHDAAANTLASTVSIEDQMRKRYGSGVQIGPALSLLDGIQAGRWLLQQGTRFHTRCKAGIEAMKHYHYEYDEDRKTFSTKPAHDWSSHTADAFRYAAVVARHSDLMTRKPKPTGVPPLAPLDRAFNLERLWQDRASDTRRRI